MDIKTHLLGINLNKNILYLERRDKKLKGLIFLKLAHM